MEYNTYQTYEDKGIIKKCDICKTDISKYPSYMKYCSNCFSKVVRKAEAKRTIKSEQTTKE